jgi:hypothetical protein
MTGKCPRKKVDALYWQGRWRMAQASVDAARQAHRLAEAGQNCNPESAGRASAFMGPTRLSRPALPGAAAS